MSKNNVKKYNCVCFLDIPRLFLAFFLFDFIFYVLYHDIVLKLKPKFASRFLVHPSQANEKNAENESPAKTWVA